MSLKIFNFFFFLLPGLLFSQTGVIKGFVNDARNNDPIIGASVTLLNTTEGTTTELDGSFIIQNIKPGIYDIEVSYLGYETVSLFEIEVQGAKPTILQFSINETSKQLDEITIKASNFKKTTESPLSLKNIGVSEIRRNPGGNRDISRVIQSLPGVTSTASFRNDLIIRGGAPNENRFFIDDVEIPNINHFATQGASGGPAGIINIDFIREVDFFGSAFPVARGNALSSVFNFKFRDGRDDRLGMIATAGATDFGMTLEGPLSDKTTFLVSARRSYLQFLFKAIGLPFLPTYTDFNAKVKYKIDNKNEIYFIGIGAIDDFSLNLEANDTEDKQFILNFLPVNTQWNYSNGVVYKHYGDKGVTSFILSRNMLNNESVKYLNNETRPENLILDYKSQEIENKLRVETTRNIAGFEWMGGALYEYVKFNANTFNKIFSSAGPEDIVYFSEIDFHKYGLFLNGGKKFLNNKLNVSFGARIDGNNLNGEMRNPFTQFSPRMALSYNFSEKLSYNMSIGRYYQLPPYPSLGYRNASNTLINIENGIKYIRADHFVVGVEYNTKASSRITLEGYYKIYDQYPFLLRESISLANLGGDFGVIGAQEVSSTSEGRTYGMELMFQQRLYKGFYGIAAYTLGFSEFKDRNGNYAPSSWDARHIINLTVGKRFGKNWEAGIKWRFQDGLPFTPFDASSSLVSNWERNGRGIPDFSRLNSERSEASSFIDFRIDKKWFFKKWDLNVYLDIQNVTASAVSRDNLILDRPLDENGLPLGGGIIENPDAPAAQQRYRLKTINDAAGTLLPTLGIVVTI
ncbi:MAG: TonB-dependent receptor [Saprospiraceae bacterium]|nr:TonB-dependent receptor [Saprospiraceae bacterium]